MRVLEKYYHELQKVVSQELLDDLVPMDIGPSAKWFLSESTQENWSYRNDFPCILAPAPVTWIEYEMPSVIRSGGEVVFERPARAVAALVMTLEVPEDDRDVFLVEDRILGVFDYFLRKSLVRKGTRVIVDGRKEKILEALAADLTCRWVAVYQLWAEPMNHRDIVPFVAYAFLLDQNGQVIDNLGVAHVMSTLGEVPAAQLNHCFADVLPFFFALSLTHCRNVEIVERELPPAIVKQRKKDGIPVWKFKNLVIRPAGGKRFVDKDKPISTRNGMLPVHFVRQHFRTYTEERPLFGKWKGTYFVGMHTRGKAEYGEITKTYKVKPGEAQ